ncbi:unnamed protein product, partial [Meganyctiphanes norvegica]
GTAEHAEFSVNTSTSITNDYCAIGLPLFEPSQPTDFGDIQCSCCKVTLIDRNEQVEHYKLDWHRANIKRSLAGKPSVTEEQFLDDISDSSSISGSEDEESEENCDEDDENESVMRRQPRIFFINADGLIISLLRCILFSKKQEICGEQDVIKHAMVSQRKLEWTIIMLGGGHFAASVFRGKDVVVHKTFHSYTVRAQQGGSQSSKDSKNASSHPKSAGSALRRYNEQSHLQHVQELMESWKIYLDTCDLIFIRAPGNNRKIIFGGRNPLLSSTDNRLRTVPFPTRRATFSEVKRVHQLLSQVKIHGNQEQFDKEIEEVKLKSMERKQIYVKKAVTKQQLTKNNISKGTSEDISITEKEQLVNSEKEKKVVNKKNYKKLNQEIKDVIDKEDIPAETSSLSIVKNHIYTACKTGNITTIKDLLHAIDNDQNINSAEVQLPINLSDALKCMNMQTQWDLHKLVFGNSGKTPLHIASENGQNQMIWYLLENGCDPSCTEANGQSSYNIAKEKETRNVFRRFMAQFPDKYDYKKAGVSSPLTAEQEEAVAVKQTEKKKAQRKAKLEREKIKKAHLKEKKREEEEKNKFLNLSDREKRALAAEMRIAELKLSSPDKGLQRCFQCASDVSKMIPFEYSNNKFCSTKCVREHRNKEK